jgi:dGTPase
LAHDLGHPPFGHVAEKKLQDICSEVSTEAFQGNAQSFRIVTNLAVRSPEEQGLDLTRATLNAILKYPWLKKDEGPNTDKWGAYTSEGTAYEEARKAAPFKESKTLEAELMDWADDVAYAVYDMEDFYRAGLVPLDRLIENNDPQSVRRRGKNTLESFLESVHRRWNLKGLEPSLGRRAGYQTQFRNLLRVFGSLDALRDPYSGTQAQRGALRHITSFLVGRYANSVELTEPQVVVPVSGYGFSHAPMKVLTGPPPVRVDDGLRMEVTMLKELTWTYVIENPSLAAQQDGQKLIVKTLYDRFTEAAINEKWNIFPSSVRTDILGAMTRLRNEPENRVRVIIDLISSMTEVQAIELYQRLTGYSAASVLQRIVG